MKKFILATALLSSFSLCSSAADSPKPSSVLKSKIAVQPLKTNEVMCADFVICEQTATICGSTPSQRARVFEYAVESLCGDGTVWT